MKRLLLLSIFGSWCMPACAGRNSALDQASQPPPVSGSTVAKPSTAATPSSDAGPDADAKARPKPTAAFSSPAGSNPAPSPAPRSGAATTRRPSTGGSAQEDPKISRSPGEPGGVVVLWPRVIPTDSTDLNRRLVQEVQTHVRVLVQRTAPGKALDVRPEPERVCRRAGCEATSVNVLFNRTGDGCAVVALITPPGPVETTLVPWAGGVELTRTQIPFREPPESYLRIKDLARCSELDAVMRQNDAAVEAAIRAAMP